MGNLFRSQDMALYQMFLQSEAAYACVAELAELGLVQFRDLNPTVNAFSRHFVAEVRRCNEMLRQLRFLQQAVELEGLAVPQADEPPAPKPGDMVRLESMFEKLEAELIGVNKNVTQLRRNRQELIELQHILLKAQVFIDEIAMERAKGGISAIEAAMRDGNAAERKAANQLSSMELSFVTGVVALERLPAFERMVWRSCRGNAFFRQSAIEETLDDPVTGARSQKAMFIVLFQGDQLRMRVRKICEGFRATMHICPESPSERREMAVDVITRIADLAVVLEQTEDHRRRILVVAAANLSKWTCKVRKCLIVYHTLNQFCVDVTQKCLIAEGWLPVGDLERIREALLQASSGSSVPPIMHRMEMPCGAPPTHNRTNKFTYAFQILIDSYGFAKYKEMNPTPYTVITFPFLFAVMFGDIGHGLIMSAFAGWMVLKEKKLLAQKSTNEIWNIMFGGRYIILLMGAFSIYTGLIYNDMFSKALNVFGSQWRNHYNETTLTSNSQLALDPGTSDYRGSPYWFGMDPVWQVAPLNSIVFNNTFKMKIAVIFGVVHMIFGLVLSAINYCNYRDYRSLWTTFAPQMIFLVSLFGYMVVLIFIKWFKYSAASPDIRLRSGCAPSILVTFIGMLLPQKDKEKVDECEAELYAAQRMVHVIIKIILMLCAPWLLLAHPISVLCDRRRRKKNASKAPPVDDPCDLHGTLDVGELWIHAIIGAIEFMLGTVSHTASYLRLWALSLAHSQLADVLWGRVLKTALASRSFVGAAMLFVVFAFWAFLTIAILVVMEGLSAFLHTLRLHWVEFQSKFYDGQGWPFEPLWFKEVLARCEQDERCGYGDR